MQFKVELDKDDYMLSGCYICTCDLEQKESKQIETVNGQLTLFTPQKYNNNHRTAHPNVGTIVQTVGNTQFEVGTQILCKHLTFEKEDKTPNHFFEENGILYYKVYNMDVMYGIDGDNLTPREGIVLAEPIFDKLLNTTLDLAGNFYDYRRDVVKLLKAWEGCTDFTEGDYLFLEEGGDYLFSFNGKDYIKCDHYFDDIMGVTDNPNWRAQKLLTHKNDHSVLTDKTT